MVFKTQTAFVHQQRGGNGDAFFIGRHVCRLFQIILEMRGLAVFLVSGFACVDFVEIPAVGFVFFGGGIHGQYAAFDFERLRHFGHHDVFEGLCVFGFDIDDDEVVDGALGLAHFFIA